MTKKTLGYKPMPTPVARRTGCKVGWNYYDPKDVATIATAVEHAKHNAKIDAAQGYDFGYQCPGHQEQMPAELPGDMANTS